MFPYRKRTKTEAEFGVSLNVGNKMNIFDAVVICIRLKVLVFPDIQNIFYYTLYAGNWIFSIL